MTAETGQAGAPLLIQRAKALFLLQAAGMVAGLGVNVVLARTLGPAGKSSVDLFLALVTSVGEIGLLGIGSGLLFLLLNQRASLAVVHGTGLALVGALSAVIAVLAFGGAPWWRPLFVGMPGWALVLAFAVVPAVLYRLAWLNLLIGSGRMQTGYWVNLLIGVATLAAVTGLAVTHQLTPVTGIVVMALSAICHAALGLGGMLKQAPALGFSGPLARQCLGFGGVMFIAQAANTMHFKADQILVNLWLGPAALGGYAVAVRWAEMLFLLDQVLSSAFMRDAVAGDVRQSWQVTRRLSLVQGAISMLAGVALMALAGPIVHYGYGVAFADAVLPMILLVPGLVAWSVSKFSSQFLIFRLGETRFVVATAVAGLGLNFLLLWLFVQRWQGALPGAALASTCSYCFVSILIMARAAQRVAQTLPPTEAAGP